MEGEKETKEYASSAGTEVQFSAFMTAVALFFISLLLQGDPQQAIPLQAPLAYLFVSAFAFFYSALIYANCSHQSPAVIRRNMDFQFQWANALSECLGVYCLGFAFPLTVISYTEGMVLPLIVLGMHVFGFVFYHFLGFSIIERNIKPPFFKILVFSILAIYVISFLLYLYQLLIPFYIVTAILGILLATAFILTGLPDYSPETIS